jgi:hypothetical protein
MASAVALFRVVERFGPADVLAVFADTRSEDADLYRFVDEVEMVSGIRISRLSDGRDVWDVFMESALFTTMGGGCKASWELKKVPLSRFAQEHATPTGDLFDGPATIYVGFDAEEVRRQDDLRRALHPWTVEYPLTWRPVLTRCELAADLRSRGIEPPRLYSKGYKHNNCGGKCILAGIKQWAGVLEDDPEGFAYFSRREQEFLAELRHRGRPEITILKDRRGGVVRNLSLQQLRDELESGERTPTDSWRESTCSCMGVPLLATEAAGGEE